jgi:hypothetical protein
MSEFQKDLRDRTKAFALRVVQMYSALPKTTEAQVPGSEGSLFSTNGFESSYSTQPEAPPHNLHGVGLNRSVGQTHDRKTMSYSIATILAVIAIIFVLITYITSAPLVPVAVILLGLAIIFGGRGSGSLRNS